MSRRFTLPKKERLRRKRAFEYLFEHGNSLRVGVLTFIYAIDVPEDWVDASVSVAFSAAKRKFKRAPDRNLLKRRMREAYRQHKQIVWDEIQRNPKNIVVLVIFRPREIMGYAEIEKSMIQGLNKCAAQVKKASEHKAPPAGGV